MFKNALICHQECVYGKFVALKDPRIAPFKMINCAGYVTLRPTQKIGSLGIGSCPLARCRGGMVPEAQGHRRPSLESPCTSKACRAREPGLGPSRRPGEVRTPSECLPGRCFHIHPTPTPTSADGAAPCKDLRKSGVIHRS